MEHFFEDDKNMSYFYHKGIAITHLLSEQNSVEKRKSQAKTNNSNNKNMGASKKRKCLRKTELEDFTN